MRKGWEKQPPAFQVKTCISQPGGFGGVVAVCPVVCKDIGNWTAFRDFENHSSAST
jgi:hypothetical protein